MQNMKKNLFLGVDFNYPKQNNKLNSKCKVKYVVHLCEFVVTQIRQLKGINLYGLVILGGGAVGVRRRTIFVFISFIFGVKT